MWKVLNEEVDFGERTMPNKQRYCGQLQNHVRIANFCWEGVDKLPFSQNLRISSWSYDMHGWSCKEVCGTILRIGKQDDATTLQSIHSMHR